MGSFLSLIIELTVVVLLAVTVTYCIILDRRLQKLRADETAMRQTVVDLGLATERAERAIEGMRASLAESDRSLGDNLKQAEATSAGLMDTIRAGDEVLDRIGKIVVSARKAVGEMDERVEERQARASQPAFPPPPATPSKLSETLAAAEAFAERARRRILDAA
jgi:Domain of unknown function (DUF6468)